MSKLNKNSLCLLPLFKIYPGRYQTRTHFDETALHELAESIREQGIIQPIVVRPDATGQYELVAGERRWRAAQLADLEEIPCLVRDYSDEQMAAVTTIENLQRCDLNPIEEAQAFQRMIGEFHYVHDELAYLLGKSRTYITNALRFLKLDERVQSLLADGAIQPGHGKVLAGVAMQHQYPLACQCRDHQWSVRKLEQAVKKLTQQASPEGNGIQHAQPIDIERLARVIEAQVGAEVKFDVESNNQSGWFKVKFYNSDTLAGLLDKMGLVYKESI